MTSPAPLKFTAKLVCVSAILSESHDKSSQTYVIRLLETDCFTAVSEKLLHWIVEYYPTSLTNRLLKALLPPHVREINLSSCSEVTLMGLVEALKKCEHVHTLNLYGLCQLMHEPIFTFIGLIQLPITTLILENSGNVTDDIVHTVIKELPKLVTLNLSGCGSITDDVFLVDTRLQRTRESYQNPLTEEYRCFTYSLACVDISGCTSLTSVAVRHLASLCGPHLRHVNLAWTSIDCTALFYLSGYIFPMIIDFVLDEEVNLRSEENLCSFLEELRDIKAIISARNTDKVEQETKQRLDEQFEIDDQQYIAVSETLADNQEHIADPEEVNVTVDDLLTIQSELWKDTEVDNDTLENRSFTNDTSDSILMTCRIEPDDSQQECGNGDNIKSESLEDGNNDHAKISDEGDTVIDLNNAFGIACLKDVDDVLFENSTEPQDNNVDFEHEDVCAFSTLSENGSEFKIQYVDSEKVNQEIVVDEKENIISDGKANAGYAICEEGFNPSEITSVRISASKPETTDHFVSEIAKPEGVSFSSSYTVMHGKEIMCGNVYTCTHICDSHFQQKLPGPSYLGIVEKTQKLEQEKLFEIAHSSNLSPQEEQRNLELRTETNLLMSLPSTRGELQNTASEEKNRIRESEFLILEQTVVCDLYVPKRVQTTLSDEKYTASVTGGIENSVVSPEVVKKEWNTVFETEHAAVDRGAPLKKALQSVMAPNIDRSAVLNETIEQEMAPNIDHGAVLNKTIEQEMAPNIDHGAVLNEPMEQEMAPNIDHGAVLKETVEQEMAPNIDRSAMLNEIIEQEMAPNIDHGGVLNETVETKMGPNTDHGAVLKKTTEPDMTPNIKQKNVFQLFQPHLISLDIGSIKFLSLKLGRLCIEQFFRINKSLQRFEISWKGLSEELLKKILPSLSDLREVCLEECTFIQNGGVAALGRECVKLTSINLRGVVFFKDMGLVPVLSLQNLTKLSLAESEVTDVTLQSLSTRLASTLTDLDLSWCEEITEKGVNSVCSTCTKLKCLTLIKCPASDLTMQLLAENCPDIQELKVESVEGISSNEFSDIGVIAIAEHLTKLVVLDISWNLSITDNAVKSVLTHCRFLKEVYMKGLKQITCQPFIPIISDSSGPRRVFPARDSNTMNGSDKENQSRLSDLSQRSTVYAPNLRVLDLEFSDLVDDRQLMEIVNTCRGSLLVTDYYAQKLEPDAVD